MGDNIALRRQLEGENREISCLSCFVWQFTIPWLLPKAKMQVGEQLFAFLDDVNTLTTPGRTCGVCDFLGEKLTLAGIRLHSGKTRCWNWNNTCPPNMLEFGREVWSP